jgi:hypothetical protein
VNQGCWFDSGIEPVGWLEVNRKAHRSAAMHVGIGVGTRILNVPTSSRKRNLLPDKKRQKADFDYL